MSVRNWEGWQIAGPRSYRRRLLKAQREKLENYRAFIRAATDTQLVAWANGPQYDDTGHRTFIRVFGFYGETDAAFLRARLLQETGRWFIAAIRAGIEDLARTDDEQ